jgi:hypothetical protein
MSATPEARASSTSAIEVTRPGALSTGTSPAASRPLARRLQALDQEPHPALEAAAVLVGAPVEVRRQERLAQHSVRTVHLDPVVARLGQVPRGCPARNSTGSRPAKRFLISTAQRDRGGGQWYRFASAITASSPWARPTVT